MQYVNFYLNRINLHGMRESVPVGRSSVRVAGKQTRLLPRIVTELKAMCEQWNREHEDVVAGTVAVDGSIRSVGYLSVKVETQPSSYAVQRAILGTNAMVVHGD